MKNIWILSIIGFLIISLTNCDPIPDDIETTTLKQRIYFQYEYVNYAWGYQHAGWLIDSSGNVLCYDKPENWYSTDSLGFITSAEMDSNIFKTDSVCYTIDKTTLIDKTGPIKNVSKGVISDPIHEMYDAGIESYYGFTYNEETKKYKKVLLKQIGDFRIDNSASEAVELYEWLDTINTLISGY